MGAMPPPSPTSFAPPMDVIRRVAFENQVPPEDIYGIAKTESNFNPQARSPKGAIGPMQLMPDTAAGLGVVDPNDPEQNYEGGAKYYAQQLKAFGGDRAKALEAYNAGPGRVAKATKANLPYSGPTSQAHPSHHSTPARPCRANSRLRRCARSWTIQSRPSRPASTWSSTAHNGPANTHEKLAGWPSSWRL